MPLHGYTALFENMLRHDNIDLRLNTDAREHLRFENGTILLDGAEFTGDVIYSGPADELFGCCFGRLPYRTLDFKFETFPADVVQSHGTVNYTMDEDYTRITEFKHLTGQVRPGVTTTVKEYSRAYTGADGEIPIMPSPTPIPPPCTPNMPKRPPSSPAASAGPFGGIPLL